MSEKFPITVVPLKEVYAAYREVPFRGGGLETVHKYEQTPHQYVIDNTDILPSTDRREAPKYIGESTKTRWLIGWVLLNVLAKEYPEDEFIKRCLDPNQRYEDGRYVVETEEAKGLIIPRMEKKETIARQEIVCFGDYTPGHEQILVRIVTPAKIKYRLKGLHLEHYIGS